MTDSHKFSAYGGSCWSPRTESLKQEIGKLWGRCGVATEWSPLKAVLLHRPGAEIAGLVDPDTVQMLALPNPVRAGKQHDAIAEAYKEEGVAVHYIEPNVTPPPNLMFVADLMFMTTEGVIIARPASTVRAGEERYIARRLAELGIPVLRSVRGKGVFEGADAAWIDPDTVMLATGHRTNAEGARQVSVTLTEMGVEVVTVGLPYGSMHLMGTLRFPDKDLAICWPGRVPYRAVEALRERGFTILFIPDMEEASRGMPLNFVTLSPRRILMPGGNPVTQAFFEDVGIECKTVDIDELLKAAGGVACLTGIIERK